MTKIHIVKLDNESVTIDRKVTNDKKVTESIVSRLFIDVAGIKGEIQPVEDESSGQHDIDIVKPDGSTLTIETTEFVLQEHMLREAICSRVLKSIDSALTESGIKPKRKCFCNFNFINEFKEKEIDKASIYKTIIKFFCGEYKEDMYQTIFRDDKVSITYMPTVYVSKNIKIDYPGNKLWSLEWNQNSYGIGEIKKQLERIINDNRKKENDVDILIVYVHNDNLHSYSSGYMDTFVMELKKLKFEGIYVIDVIETTLVFPEGEKSTGNIKSTRNGEDFNLTVKTVRQHPDIEKGIE